LASSLLQLVRQAVPGPLQAYAPQVVVLIWLQVPLPLQNDCGW
jgi:hypothetical protein